MSKGPAIGAKRESPGGLKSSTEAFTLRSAGTDTVKGTRCGGRSREAHLRPACKSSLSPSEGRECPSGRSPRAVSPEGSQRSVVDVGKRAETLFSAGHLRVLNKQRRANSEAGSAGEPLLDGVPGGS